MTTQKEERKAQAMEIVRQLGGGQFIAMTGARFIAYDDRADYANVSFKFMGSHKATHVKIELDWSDTYVVTFYKIRGETCKIVDKTEGVYNDMLKDLFTSVTGLDCTMGTMRG